MAVPVIVAVSRASLYAAGQAAAILPAPAFALNLFFVLASALPFALDFAVATAEFFLILAGIMAVIVTPVRVGLARDHREHATLDFVVNRRMSENRVSRTTLHQSLEVGERVISSTTDRDSPREPTKRSIVSPRDARILAVISAQSRPSCSKGISMVGSASPACLPADTMVARFATRRGPPLQAHRRPARFEFCSHARCRNWDMPAAIGTGEVGSTYQCPPRTRPRLLDQCSDSET